MSNSLRFATELIKKYKWQSIFLKYWKTLILVFMLPFFIINILVYSLNTRILNNEFNSSVCASYDKISDNIENMFLDSDLHYGLLVSDTNIIHHLTSPGVYKRDEQAKFFYEQMNSFMISRDFIGSMHIYSVADDYVYSSAGGQKLENFHDKTWYEHYKKTGSHDFVISVINPSTGKTEKISICYGLTSNKEIIGFIVFNISASYINDFIRSELNTNLDSLTLLDSAGAVLYSSDNEASKKVQQLKSVFPNPTDTITRFDNKRDAFFIKSINGNAYTLIFDVNDKYFNSQIQNIRLTFIVCLILIIFIPLLMAMYISLNFYKSIHTITLALNSSDYEENTDEISYILSNIMQMTMKNKHFETELVKKIQQLKKTQTVALQLQFNPHFLFNTLNMINVLVSEYANGDNDASRAIVLLSDLLYASMNTNDYLITLQEELDYEKNYVEILRIQHENRFSIQLDIDERTKNFTVIKLMLQPIIENAFRYGMKMMPPDEVFELKISTDIVDNNFVIKVFNNGKGMEAQKLEELKASFNTDNIITTKHIGLNNINQRIKIIFGEQYGVDVESGEIGFTTILTLPQS